jgi:hypothetical protein
MIVLMNGMWGWLSSHGVSLTGVGAAVAFVFSVYQFLSVRKRESRQKEFDQYHSLIEKLVSPRQGQGQMFLDQQIAVVFELRNFPRYFELTERMLAGLHNSWLQTPGWVNYDRLIQELGLTLQYIRNYERRRVWGIPILIWR